MASICYSDLIKNLPSRLRIARLARGYSNQFTFTQTHHLPTTTYKSHETGKTDLKVGDLAKYADILNISIGWLLTGVGHPLDHLQNPDPKELKKFDNQIKIFELLSEE